MKKLLIATNILFLSIIFYQSCAPARAIVAAATCPPCKDYSGVTFPGLTTTTALILSTDYKSLNQPLLALNHGTVSDANSIWFSLETLKTFIWNIESEACKHGCYNSAQAGVGNLNLGVRIYYGRYPDDDTMGVTADLLMLPHNTQSNQISNSYALHHTLFMVPTYQDATNSSIQWDFDPWHWSTGTSASCIPTTMSQWLVDTIAPFGSSRSLILSQTSSMPVTNSTTVYNHGDMIPPGTATNNPPQGPGY